MASRRASIRLACLSAAALALPPAAAQARVVDPISVSKSVTVPAGESRSLTLGCPARAVALNGVAPAATSSIPGPNGRGWTFRFAGGAGAGSGDASLRCVRLRLPKRISGIGLVVETRIEPVAELAPGASARLDVSCSNGHLPTGWGLERAGAGNGIAVTAATPRRRGWSFAFVNAGAGPAAATATIRCLERRQRARSGQRHAFATRVASFQESAAATARRSCRRTEFSLATGVSLPRGVHLLDTALFGARGGEWTFSAATTAETSLVCLARTTRFSR
jgi:hypothetical protein